MCVCRSANGQIVLPAPRFGAYQCDTPYDLAMSAMEAIPVLTGTKGTGFNFTIFTGAFLSRPRATKA